MLKLFKPLFLFAVTFLLAFETKAQPAIHMNFDVKKADSSLYVITVTGNIPLSWHVYGINQTGDGLTPSFHFDYENVVLSGEPSFSSSPQLLSGPRYF